MFIMNININNSVQNTCKPFFLFYYEVKKKLHNLGKIVSNKVKYYLITKKTEIVT